MRKAIWVVLVCIGCNSAFDDAAVLPNSKIAFPVSSMRVGDIAYVAADGLRVDDSSHKLYINTAAPTFVQPTGAATVALRRNQVGFDVDLSNNTDWFIPMAKQESSAEAIATSIAIK